MSAEDRFEEELVVRLGARAAEVDGSPPLAGLREAGRRRARRQNVVRGVTAVAVLVVGAGVLTQLGGGGTSSGTGVGGGPAGAPKGAASPSAGWSWVRGRTMLFGCNAGPSSLRTPGMHYHPTAPPPTPSSVISSSSPPISSGPPVPPPTIRFTPTASGSPSTLSSAQVMQIDLVRAAEAVDKMASESHRDYYFGVCHDPRLNTLYVMRVPGSGDLDAAVARVLTDWPAVQLRFTDAAASLDEQQQLADRINADRGYWRDKGVQMSANVANDGSGVVVDTPQWESAGPEIKAKYGSLVVEVR